MGTVQPNADLLRELREQKHLTQEDLAELADVSVDTVQRVEHGENISADALQRILRSLKPGITIDQVIAHTIPGVPPSKLMERITERELWADLERRLREIVMSGGMVAQGFYRNAGPRLNAWVERDPAIEKLIHRYRRENKNPPAKADLVATQTILREADSLLSPVADELGCGLQLLCEETTNEDFRGWLKDVLGDTYRKVQDPNEFFTHGYAQMRVIADAVDGTTNFMHGLPFFCSAAAILIDDIPRVAAIYEALHGVVYTATLPGPRANPQEGGTATAWDITSGNWVDLRVLAAACGDEKLSDQTVAIHLTRSDAPLRRSLIAKLDAIVEASKGICALNAGLPAMASVARAGGLGAFVNNCTSLWDVAAGEVLVRAVGGVVTQLNGADLSYSTPGKVSVVAAKNKRIHTKLRSLLA
jgi:fructose-1,6-bisphosphatase/inositol monophosphatase family enzyme/transcriptional regulator with XRE-family HTH domain